MTHISLVLYLILIISAPVVKRTRPRAAAPKKANAAPPKDPGTFKVKREPVSPPKRAAVKRGFETAIGEDDQNDVGEDQDSVEKIPGPSKGIPVVEISTGRRVTRQSTVSTNKASKKVRYNSESTTDLHDILKEQFEIISTAFTHIGDAFAKHGLRDE